MRHCGANKVRDLTKRYCVAAALAKMRACGSWLRVPAWYVVLCLCLVCRVNGSGRPARRHSGTATLTQMRHMAQRLGLVCFGLVWSALVWVWCASSLRACKPAVSKVCGLRPAELLVGETIYAKRRAWRLAFSARVGQLFDDIRRTPRSRASRGAYVAKGRVGRSRRQSLIIP